MRWKQLLHLIMKTAPGLGAYFAYQVGILGPQLFGAYAKPLGLYYGVCAFTLWYFLASMLLWRDKWVEGFGVIILHLL
jgi:hypothetical protein